MFLPRNSYLNTQSETNNSRRGSTLLLPSPASNKRKTLKAPPEKREISEHVKKIARRLFYKVKLYNMLERAKRQVRNHEELTNPVYSRLIRILSNTFRSNANCEFILEYIRSLSFFANFVKDLGEVEEDALPEICRELKYEHFPAASCIVKEGDRSNDKFYVILKGSVSVIKRQESSRSGQPKDSIFMNTEHPASTDREPESPKSPKKRRNAVDADRFDGVQLVVEENKEFEYEDKLEKLIASLGLKLSELVEGEGFGEKALLKKGGRRMASIVANTGVDLLIVQKDTYIKVVTKFDKRRQTKIKFMKNSIPYLNSVISSVVWDNLFFLIHELDPTKGTVIATEGAEGKHIYFVQSGFCDLEKVITVENKKVKNHIDSTKFKKKIATFGSGSCLGEEILDPDQGSKYEYTITVATGGTRLYYVDKSSLMGRFPKETIHAIVENFQSKQAVHHQKLKKITEDLYLSNPTNYSKAAASIQIDNLSQLMNPSMKNSMVTHFKIQHEKERADSAKRLSVDINPAMRNESSLPGLKRDLFVTKESNSKSAKNSLKLRSWFKKDPNVIHRTETFQTEKTNDTLADSRFFLKGLQSSRDEAPSSRRETVESPGDSPVSSSKFERYSPVPQRRLTKFQTVGTPTLPSNDSIDRKRGTIIVETPQSALLEKFDFGDVEAARSPTRKKLSMFQSRPGGNSSPLLPPSETRITSASPLLKSRKKFSLIQKLSMDHKDSSNSIGTPKREDLNKLRLSIGLNTEEYSPIQFSRTMMSVKSIITTNKKNSFQITPQSVYTNQPKQEDEEEIHKPIQKNPRFKVGSIEIFKNNFTEPDQQQPLSPPKQIPQLFRKPTEENTLKPRLTVKEKRRVQDSLNPKKLKEKMNSKIKVITIIKSPRTTKFTSDVLHTMY